MDIYEEITRFYERTTGEKRIIGKSVLHRKIYAVKVGRGRPVGLVQYALHGREFVTARLAPVHYYAGVKTGSLWIIPLMNPDGALLSETGLSSVKSKNVKKRLLALNNGKEDFSLWKANARGVDLNVNFPAEWGKGTSNVFSPAPENYVGKKPFSEPETLALKRFTEKIHPDYTVSYHTKGEEIYWYFYQPIGACMRDKRLAQALSRSTGYALAHAKGSAGGYKDWCIQALHIPSFTVEAGADEFTHPLKEDGLKNIIERNRLAIYDLSSQKDAFETASDNIVLAKEYEQI